MKVNSVTLKNYKKLNFKGLNAQKIVNNVISTEAPKFQKALIPLTAVPVLAATIINSKQNKQNQEIQPQENSQETLNEKFIPNFTAEDESSNLKPAERKMPFAS